MLDSVPGSWSILQGKRGGISMLERRKRRIKLTYEMTSFNL